jgi:hypothetical protein
MSLRLTPNRRRGEIGAVLDGEPRVLCLTLGALAELESAFAVDNLSELALRFSSGGLSARDITRILGAGLRGAGHAFSDEDVALMSVEGGAAGAAELVSALLRAAFSPDMPVEEGRANP